MPQVLRIQTDEPFFSMTFDDGPDPEGTPIVLEALARIGARATFFVIGEKVLRHPDLVRAMVRDSHEVGNHSYTHLYFLKARDGEILRQIDLAQYAVFDACGVMPKLFRAPHGRVTQHQLAMLTYNRPVTPCYWSVDAKDWRDHDAELVTSRIIEATSQGDIVIGHDTLACSVAGSIAALQDLSDRGLSSVPVSELLGKGAIEYLTQSQLPGRNMAEA